MQIRASQPLRFFRGDADLNKYKASFTLKKEGATLWGAAQGFSLRAGLGLVLFAGRETQAQLLERYKQSHDLDWETVSVESAMPITKREKRQFVVRALQAHEHALRNKLLGNFSGSFFSTSLQLANGQKDLGTTFETTREKVLCGERSAMITAWNSTVKHLDLGDLKEKSEADLEKIREGMKAKNLVLSSAKDLGTSHVSACSECQEWLATHKYFGPDVQLINLKQTDFNKDSNKKEFVLNIQTVAELLPFNGKQEVSRTEGLLDEQFPVEVSEAAQKVMAKKGQGSVDDLLALMREAKSTYNQLATANYSDKQVSSAVLFKLGKGKASMIVQGRRFDWTRRWFESPEILASATGYQQLKDQYPDADERMIFAVAYYGDEPTEMPSVASLGKLAQGRGAPECLIIVLENDVLKVRTVSDYMTDIYISPNALS